MSLKDVGATVGTIQSKSRVCREDLERSPLMKSSAAHQVFGLFMDNYIVSAFSGCSTNLCYNPTYHFCSQTKLPGLDMSNVAR